MASINGRDRLNNLEGLKDSGNYTKRILDLATSLGALKYGDFILTSGKKSKYYFDGRLLTLDPEGSYLVANAVINILVESKVKVTAGPAIAAVPIVAAVSALSYLQGCPIGAVIIRNEAKKHGTGKIIEGILEKGDRVAVVDDTCSTGGSLLRAIEQVEESGGEVVKVISILDRHMGGSDLIKSKGYDFITILDADVEGKIKSGIQTI